METVGGAARASPCGINNPSGSALDANEIVDFDICWAYNLADPWGNVYELNCYEYERIENELIGPDEIDPVRYWPRKLYDGYTAMS